MAGTSSSIKAMQQVVTSCMVRRIKIEADKNKARRGVVRGGSVTCGNRSYGAIPVVDMYYEDGDSVWCIADDSSGTAIIVGV